jgi:hypothetical protein
MNTSSSNNNSNAKLIEITEDHRKKIESTQFVFVVAMSAVGKTFIGDYLEAIQGWKHVDGMYMHALLYLYYFRGVHIHFYTFFSLSMSSTFML